MMLSPNRTKSVSAESTSTSASKNTVAASGNANSVSLSVRVFWPPPAEVLLLFPTNVVKAADAAATMEPPYFTATYLFTRYQISTPATNTTKLPANQLQATVVNQPVERPNHSRSASECGCQLVSPTKIISAMSC